MSKWSQLPNAAHIDRILVSLKANPKIWADAWNARSAGINAAWSAAWEADLDAAHVAVGDGGIGGIYDAGVASGAAWDAAWYTILALIAYDDAAKYLDLPLDQLKMLFALTEHPAALLLQPAVLAFSMERALA